MDWNAARAFYLQTRSLKQTAEQFGLPLNTVKTRARREAWAHREGSASVHDEPSEGSNDAAQGSNGSAKGSSRVRVEPSEDSNGSVQGSGRVHTESQRNPAVGNITVPTNGQSRFQVPADINEWDRLTAARFYFQNFHWAVHHLFPPSKGDDKERGKRPWCKGWRDHTAAEVTLDDLSKVLGPHTDNNLGVVVRPPFIAVDLDSKADGGESVRAWLAQHPQLADVPRERTGGGVHLHFLCRDLPAHLLKVRKAPTVQINEKVTAELYLNGLNLAVAPSIHKSGHRYVWEVTGEVPEVKWAQICGWFGFEKPEEKRGPGRPRKEAPWWAAFKGDLATLDILALFRSAKMLGECLSPDDAKWSVRCPWEYEHSTQVADIGSDTAVFAKEPPAFKCLHAHCAERALKEVCQRFESREPGIVDKLCRRQRVFQKGATTPEGRPQIVLPAPGTSQSEFSTALGGVIGPCHEWFAFRDEVVRIHEGAQFNDQDEAKGIILQAVTPSVMVTASEHYAQTGQVERDQAGDPVFVIRSMTETDARITLDADSFKRQLPRIQRILDVPVPLLRDDGTLWFPKPGYDAKLRVWLDPAAPAIRPMKVEEAVDLLLGELLTTEANGGWCWKDDQSRTHALARVITPMCRGLMGWRRTPLWIFCGNREGCGKDTLASTTFQLYINRPSPGAPLSKENDDEMRKRITTCLMSGARYIHFGNLKGHIRFPALEAATDDIGGWEDRQLGVNKNLVLKNEAEFSFSVNNGTWEPDIERRARRISLHLVQDNGNDRDFRHPNVLRWVSEHRSELLSAVAALIHHWVAKGCPPGPSKFASFPEWARVVGGVMNAAGLPDPCQGHHDPLAVAGDQGTDAMRKLCRLAHIEFGERWVTRKELYELIEHSEELFPWLDLSTRSGQTQLGRLLARNDRREFGGVLFSLIHTSKNYTSYQFQAMHAATLNMPESGTSGTSGTSAQPVLPEGNYLKTNSENERDYLSATEKGGTNVPEVPEVPDPASSGNAPLLVSDRKTFPEIAASIRESGSVALDLETYGPRKGDGLNPWKGDIRLLSLCRQGRAPWIVDLRATGYDLGELGAVLQDIEVIAHNSKFDALWLRVKCGLKLKNVFCTMTASRLLTNGGKERNGLDDCLKRHLDIEPGPDHSASDWGGMFLTDDQLAYAARDVRHLHDLSCVLRHELEMEALDEANELEQKLLPVVVEMEAAGIGVDRDKLDSIKTKAEAEGQSLAEQVRQALGKPSLNPASPDQLLDALRAVGIHVENTSEDTLKAVSDGKIVPLLLAYREQTKLAQQAASLLESVQRDGRIHGRFEPTGTQTGRFSSRDPNLQNIGRGELRSILVAQQDSALVVADYSQIELRAAAAIAGETKMIEAYQRGEDLHRQTASVVLGKSPDEVTKEDRQLAKAVNFGLLYGQSAPGLVRYAASSYGVKLEAEQADSIRKAFFRTYGALRQWHGESHVKAGEGIRNVRTVIGRRRIIPPEASEWNRFTALVNTPVQGGCADGMKRAMILLADRLPDGCRMVSTVHDELVVEAPREEAEAVRNLVVTVMREAMEDLFPQVPIEVEAKVCRHWGEKG